MASHRLPRHHLLIRRHLTTGKLAFHYCYLPDGQPASPTRPVRAAGLRWPCEEDFEFGKDCFGPGQAPVRRYTAIARHTALVMATLAVCAVTAALLRRRTGTHAPAPVLPDQPPPADPGMIPLTVPETGRLLGHPPPPGSAGHWLDWRRRHQARSHWYHQRTRLARPSGGAHLWPRQRPASCRKRAIPVYLPRPPALAGAIRAGSRQHHHAPVRCPRPGPQTTAHAADRATAPGAPPPSLTGRAAAHYSAGPCPLRLHGDCVSPSVTMGADHGRDGSVDMAPVWAGGRDR